MSEHIEELAELYAVGTLDEHESALVERHVTQCDECARRLRFAQRTVAAMAELEPAHAAPEALLPRLSTSLAARTAKVLRTWQISSLAFAAAFALALLPLGMTLQQMHAMHVAMAQEDTALARMGGTAFSDSMFHAPGGGTMPGHVLYSHDGSWYYVVIMHPRAGMQIAYAHGGKLEMLGRVAMHGQSGTLYLPVNHKMDDLALLDDGTVVADAHLTY